MINLNEEKKLKDDSLMPFGLYKGIKMANIPAHYLLWLKEQKNQNKQVMAYIEDNIDVLEKES